MSKLYYSIGELERILGETQSTIKFWERQFKHLQPKRTPGKTRLYTESDIDAFRVIQSLLRDKGLTIAGAKDALKRKGDSLELRQKAITGLRATLLKLEALRDELKSNS